THLIPHKVSLLSTWHRTHLCQVNTTPITL
ncbi:membrane MotB of proton-channel complex MotA/MotB family protein, partial [Vibrio parahaemolyticus V-223/04]